MSPDEPTPIDLSALGPALSRERLEALVAATVSAAAPELARRRTRPTLSLVVVRWQRPVMGLAGLAAAAAMAVMVLPSRRPVATASTSVASATTVSSDSMSVAGLLGVPTEYTALVEGTTSAPTAVAR